MPTAYAPERGQLGSTLVASYADNTQVADTTTETIIVPDYTIPANFMTAGATLKGIVKGVCSNVVTTPGTLTYHIHVGTATLSATSDTASAALGLDTTARTSFPWQLTFTIQCRAVGASGSILVLGQVWQSNVLASTAANLLPNFMPASSIAATTMNTTVANLLGVSAKFSVNTSGTNITANEYVLESIS